MFFDNLCDMANQWHMELGELMPKTNNVRMQHKQPRVMAWNVSQEVLNTLDMYSLATGVTKYELVEQALIEYFIKIKAKQEITKFLKSGIIG
jgi:hypothetical protein